MTISLTPQDVVCSLSPVRACGFGDCDSSLSRARRLPDLRGCRAPEAGLALRGGSSAPALGESISEHLSMHLALLVNALIASNAAVTVYKAVSLAAERLTGFGPLSSCELIWGTRAEYDPWISSRVIAGIACCGAASVSTFLLAARMGFALLIHAAPLAIADVIGSWGALYLQRLASPTLLPPILTLTHVTCSPRPLDASPRWLAPLARPFCSSFPLVRAMARFQALRRRAALRASQARDGHGRGTRGPPPHSRRAATTAAGRSV